MILFIIGVTLGFTALLVAIVASQKADSGQSLSLILGGAGVSIGVVGLVYEAIDLMGLL